MPVRCYGFRQIISQKPFHYFACTKMCRHKVFSPCIVEQKYERTKGGSDCVVSLLLSYRGAPIVGHDLIFLRDSLDVPLLFFYGCYKQYCTTWVHNNFYGYNLVLSYGTADHLYFLQKFPQTRKVDLFSKRFPQIVSYSLTHCKDQSH
jgi:hypothetical protein